MKALVKNIALPATQLPPTREYHEEFKIPESWEAQRAAKKRIAEAKRKKHTRTRLKRSSNCLSITQTMLVSSISLRTVSMELTCKA